jgi:large conductance mechanosensitive channel
MAGKKQLTKNEVLQKVEAAKETLENIQAPIVGKRLSGFFEFVRQQGVVGLAIGLVLGTQVKTLVDQLVASFINPLLGLLLPGGGSLSEKSFHASLYGKSEDFLWGAFVSQLISFIVVAAVIYFVFKGLKLDKLDKPKSGS